MTRRKVIVWCLGVAQLALATTALLTVNWWRTYWGLMHALVIVIGQYHLVGVWVATGGRRSPRRLVAMALCLTLLTLWLKTDLVGSGPAFFHLLLLAWPSVLFTAGFLFLMRLCGPVLHHPSDTCQSGPSSKLQFSLRSLFKWMLAVAVVLGLLSSANPYVRSGGSVLSSIDDLIFPSLLFAAICVVEMAVLLSIRPVRHVCLWGAFLGLTGMWLAAIYGRRDGEATLWVVLAFCEMLWFALSFLPLRLLGYRFGRCRPTSPEPPASDALADCPFCVRSDLAD